MHKKFSENMAFRLLAVFLALVLWVYVTYQENPVMERSIRVSLKQQGLPANMTIESMPSDVIVYYKSSRDKLSMMDAGSFEARVNLTGLEAGRHSLPVQVKVPQEVNVVRVSPERVNVTLEEIISKNISVVPSISGDPAPGYKTGEPSVVPPVIKATGPKSVLSNIKEVTVDVEINGARSNVEKNCPVTLGIKEVSLNPSSVDVIIPVAGLPTKIIPVEVQTEGEPEEGYKISSISADPPEVEVTGPGDLLQNLESIKTEEVDISGAHEEINQNVHLQVPDGVEKISNEKVQVNIEIMPNDTSFLY